MMTPAQVGKTSVIVTSDRTLQTNRRDTIKTRQGAKETCMKTPQVNRNSSKTPDNVRTRSGRIIRVPRHRDFILAIYHTFLWFIGSISHAGCWKNTRRDYKSQAKGEWFTSFSSIIEMVLFWNCLSKRLISRLLLVPSWITWPLSQVSLSTCFRSDYVVSSLSSV